MTKCRDPQGIDRWRGFGIPVSCRGLGPGDVNGALALLRDACAVTTPHRAAAMHAMATTTGGKLSVTVRGLAWRGRRDAAKHGIALPPWWKLRLATRIAAWRESGGKAPPIDDRLRRAPRVGPDHDSAP